MTGDVRCQVAHSDHNNVWSMLMRPSLRLGCEGGSSLSSSKSLGALELADLS